jgi:hypothetical protein
VSSSSQELHEVLIFVYYREEFLVVLIIVYIIPPVEGDRIFYNVILDFQV